jgi:hypothetical protein
VAEAPRRVGLNEVGDLMAPGAPLPFAVLDNLGRLLLAAGQRVHDARQLNALLERGGCVNEDEAAAVRLARASGDAAAAPAPRQRSWFDRFDRQTWGLDDLLRQLGRGERVAAQIEAFADDHIALVERQLDAALFVAVRQDDKRFALYSLTHAIHTATAVLVTARQLGWRADDTRRGVLVALTMNAAIVELQARMAEQSDPPSRKQLDQIRAHPQQSAQQLRAGGVADEVWLAAVEAHHERADGSGYPLGSTQAGPIAHVVRAADVFMAKISPRALRAPLPPQQAARQLFQEEKGGTVATALIKAVGIYAPGDFVKLKNGESAVVVQRAASGNVPPVAALLGATGRPLHGAPRRDTTLPEYMIAGALADHSGLPRVLPEQIFGILPG